MLAQGLADQWADGQVGDIVVVHDVEVNNVCARLEHVVDFLAQLGKVGGKDGGGNLEVSHGLASEMNKTRMITAPEQGIHRERYTRPYCTWAGQPALIRVQCSATAAYARRCRVFRVMFPVFCITFFV